MKTLLTFQLISLLCYSSKDQVPSSKSVTTSYSSKEVISSKMVIEGNEIIYSDGNPLDIIMRMPTFTPIPKIVSLKPITEVNP